METRLDFWHRQTLRERPAEILKDWKDDSFKKDKQIENLLVALVSVRKLNGGGAIFAIQNKLIAKALAKHKEK